MAPAVAGVRDYTDGDETGYIPHELGAALAEVAPDLLPRYYRWLAGREDYHAAEAVFREFLRMADLADPVARAIAKTATDEAALSVVRERARGGDANARVALDAVAESLGAHVHEDPLPALSQSNAAAPTASTDAETDRREPVPDPAAYPPGRLREFLAVESAPPYYRRERVGMWLDHWRSAGHPSEALADAEQLIRTGVDLGNSERLYTLTRELRGRHAAYPWLVRTYRDDWGWRRYSTPEERAEQRWALVERDYPERWLDFLRDTLLGPEPVPWAGLSARMELPRLVRYLIRVGQPGLAAEVTERTVRVTLELVSPAPVGVPGWVASA